MLITDNERLKEFNTDRRVWQGIPSIERTKGGRIFVCFYSGKTKETFGNYAVLLKSDDGVNFGQPIATVFKSGDFRCYDACLWIDPLNRLWFIWNVMPGEQVYASICDNPDAETLVWGEEFYIGRGTMLNKPTVLSDGAWLFPIAFFIKDYYIEMRESGYRENDIVGSFVYKTVDNGKTFERLGYADVPHRIFDEHMVVEQNDGSLRMLVRTSYGIGESYSFDGGYTWTNGKPSGLNGPNSRFHVKRLKSGRLLLINHHEFTGRTQDFFSGRNNLTAYLSDDDGKTFPHKLLLDGRNDVSYPDAVEGDDGFIYIVYDRERGCFKSSLEEAYSCAREVLYAKITEADILGGKLITDGSFLARVVNKLDKLSKDLPNPFSD